MSVSGKNNPQGSVGNSEIFRNTLDYLEKHSSGPGMSLPGVFYTDPNWLDLEQKWWFLKNWLCVGREEEVPNNGDFFAIDLVDEPVVIVRGMDGVIRALSNVCRHRGTVIADGAGNVKSFLCPYHHWAYDTAGKLVHAPSIESNSMFDVKNCRLPEFKCETWNGFVFVCLSNDAPDLLASLVGLNERVKNYHLEEMRLQYLVDETWNINWKSLVENFMEGYHLSPLHRSTLHKVNPSSACRHFDSGENYFGYDVDFTTRLPEERIGHPDLSDEELDNCVMFAVPPGLTVGVGSDYSSFLCIRPDSPLRVKVKMGLIFYGDSWKKKDINNAIKLFQDTMQEDKEVLIRVQQGLASNFHQPGPLAGHDLEGTIWDFYQFMRKNLKPAFS